MASTLKEQSKDLSTCCVCMEMFENEGQLKPKSLACLHTYCLGCLKTLIQLPAKTVNCPVCKVVQTIPGGVDSLPTNTFALHIVNLNKSISNGFFVERLTSGTGLNCKNLLGPLKTHLGLDFSQDESLLVVGGLHHQLLLWRTEDVFEKKNLNPSALNNTTEVLSLAISPLNDRIFTGGFDSVRIYDIERREVVRQIPDGHFVLGLDLQPGSNGNIFASACDGDGELRVYDVRSKDAVLVTERLVDRNEAMLDPRSLYSLMFSPSQPNVIAVTGRQSVEIIDIRDIDESLQWIPVPVSGHKNVKNASFNRKGTRLLCSEKGSSPVIYHLGAYHSVLGAWMFQEEPTQQRLFSPDYNSVDGTEGVCFAGKDDELAIVSSENGDIHIWSVPEDQKDSVDKPLLVLSGHESYVFSARYSDKYGALATTGVDVVKLWTTHEL